jgi:hypothetical protein
MNSHDTPWKPTAPQEVKICRATRVGEKDAFVAKKQMEVILNERPGREEGRTSIHQGTYGSGWKKA